MSDDNTPATPIVKLDLACGNNKAAGFTGVDRCKTDAVDIVHDLKVHPWPFADESVDEVVCNHFIEHLDGVERIAFMEELYRVMKTGAKATFTFPYWSSSRSVQDPTHKFPPMCEQSFLYFNKNWMKDNKLEHYNINADFDFVYGYNLNGMCPAQILKRNDETKSFMVSHYINSVSDGQVTLTRRAKG